MQVEHSTLEMISKTELVPLSKDKDAPNFSTVDGLVGP